MEQKINKTKMVSTQTVTIERASHGLHTTCHLELDVSVFFLFLYEGCTKHTHTHIHNDKYMHIHLTHTYTHQPRTADVHTYQRSTCKYRIE